MLAGGATTNTGSIFLLPEVTALKTPWGRAFLWDSGTARTWKTLSETESLPLHGVRCIGMAGCIKNGRAAADKHLSVN